MDAEVRCMGQVLAVISGKGGTGKTSVCAGVAGCLCLEGCLLYTSDAADD